MEKRFREMLAIILLVHVNACAFIKTDLNLCCVTSTSVRTTASIIERIWWLRTHKHRQTHRRKAYSMNTFRRHTAVFLMDLYHMHVTMKKQFNKRARIHSSRPFSVRLIDTRSFVSITNYIHSHRLESVVWKVSPIPQSAHFFGWTMCYCRQCCMQTSRAVACANISPPNATMISRIALTNTTHSSEKGLANVYKLANRMLTSHIFGVHRCTPPDIACLNTRINA